METNPLTVNDDAIADEAFEPTEAEMLILNASDREIEEMQANCNPPEGGIMPRRKPETNEQILIAVAAIAGWTDIKIWNPHAIKKSYVGVNLAHPELGIHIPNYVGSVDAIAPLVTRLLAADMRKYQVTFEPSDRDYGTDGEFRVFSEDTKRAYEAFGVTLAETLCEFLLEIAPHLNPEKVYGEIESQVLEATFGS